MEKLLKIKIEQNKKRPNFLAQDSHKLKRIKNKWRKGRGSDSKVRHKLKGRKMRVEDGYRTPRKVRGLTLTGLKKLYISNIDQLNNASLENVCIVINKTVGMRKKIEIIKLCINKKLKILGCKKPEELIRNQEDKFKNKKETNVKEKKVKTENKSEEKAKEVNKKEIKEENNTEK